MMSFFDWLGRVIMLVLAGMITLSIIGSIAAIPSGSSIERQMGIERTDWPQAHAQEQRSAPKQTPQQVAREVKPPPPEQPQLESTPAGQVPAHAGVAAPPPRVDPARWLEVIAYALLALVGLAALGVVIAWRSLRQRRRIAEAVESLSVRNGG